VLFLFVAVLGTILTSDLGGITNGRKIIRNFQIQELQTFWATAASIPPGSIS
jgi:hypothetical protein